MKIPVNKFKSAIKKYNNILIYIKGSPDPDAIASAFVIKNICNEFGINTTIFAEKNLSLPQNKAFVKILNIPIKFGKTIPDIEKYDAYAVVDYQSAYVEKITGKIPCVLHIDHHETINEEIEVNFKLINNDAGSACTIIAQLLKGLNLDFKDNSLTTMATALLYGIQTDTDKYTHAGKEDLNSLNYLSKYSDSKIINKISGIPLSEETVKLLNKAIKNQLIYKDWLISGIDFIDEANRDSIAIIADFLLKRKNVSTVIVFAVIKNNDNSRLTLDASIRTDKKNNILNDIIKKISPEGGARKYKGAYQVNLNYFVYCPNKSMLWDVIRLTTIEKLQTQRDDMYKTEIEGFINKFRKKLSDYLSN